MIILIKKVYSVNYKNLKNRLDTYNLYNKNNILIKNKCTLNTIDIANKKIIIKKYPCLRLKLTHSKIFRWIKIILLKKEANI